MLIAGRDVRGKQGGRIFLEESAKAMAVDPPNSFVGRQMGVYQIRSMLGAGGMGEVYLAKDTRLGRDVAIKILPEIFADNPDRLARFEREARVLASLNHPNIAAIYGLEEFFGQQFLVMELVDGETLAQRIKRTGPATPEDALDLAYQIAEGLEAAHLKGVTHRDVKPANVKVTPEGRVKILDFGLAKAIWGAGTDQDVSQIPTVTELGTERGRIMGTPSYMSPEQACGKPVDQRTDIWAFGCLLFELLASTKAFRGETSPETLAAILERDPRWEALPAATPARLRDLLRRCLQKDAELRFQNMRGVRLEIEAIRAKREGWRLTRLQAVAVAAVLLAAFLAILAGPNLLRRWRALGLPKQKLVVVLPFRNIGGDTSQQAFCDGLTEVLTSALTRLSGLSVIAPSESRRLESAKQARQEFGVNLVIYGSVLRRGDAVRLTVSLIDAESQRQVATTPIDWPLSRLADLESTALRQVADLLNVVLSRESRDLLAGGSSQTADAYDAYLQGRGFLYQYDTAGNMDRARQQFEEATRLDSGFAAAYAGLAETYSRIFRARRETNVLPLARAAAERAVALNTRFAGAHLALGAVLADLNQPDDAVRELEAALKLDSLDPAAYLELARVQRAQRKYPEAEQTFLRAIAARPDDWQSYSQLAVFYSSQQRDADAEKFFRKVTELAPDGPTGYRNLGATLFRLGRNSEAEVMMRKSVALRPTVPAYSNLGALMMFLGRYSDAVRAMEEATKLAPDAAPNNYLVWGNLGDAYWLSKASPEKSRAAWTKAAQIGERQLTGKPADSDLLSLLALYQAKLDNPVEAKARAAQALAFSPESAVVHYQASLAYTLIGDKERGFAELKAAIERGYSKSEIRAAPELATLRSDPKFESITKRDAGR